MLSIVVPAHNEEEGISSSIGQIEEIAQKAGYKYEIIVVDDGSTDGTFANVKKICDRNRNVRCVKFARNFGKEAALYAGLSYASGDAVVTIDADLQHPPALIPQMVRVWRDGNSVVHAVKDDRSSDSRLARFRARVFNALLTRLGRIQIGDSSDFKLLDRAIVDILIRLPERGRFYRGLADWVGFRQSRIPFRVESRNAGEGKWSLLSLVGLAVTAVVSFTSAPLRIVTILGLLTLVFGLVVAAEAFWSWLAGEAVSGFATTIITLLIVGSSIMISLGIMGEYIAKIYDEIKRRPSYLVESEVGFD